jgi:hypothetical protein
MLGDQTEAEEATMIPYMHQDLAAERAAWIQEQARRDRVARIARRARRARRREAERMPAPSPLALTSALRPRSADGSDTHAAAERREVA